MRRQPKKSKETFKKLEAHAFGMLVPNALFPDDMLTEAERESKRVQETESSTGRFRTYMCDGVYDCHPSKTKTLRGESTEDGQEAPWLYDMIVSALVFGKGQVYFEDEQGRYGVNANDFFPTTSLSLTDALGDRTTLDQRREAATTVLKCNIPRCVRTFGHPNASPLQRLRDVTMNTPHRAERLIETFGSSMQEKTLKDFRGYAQGRLASCMNKDTQDKLLQRSSEFREFAAQIQPDGSMVKETTGEYGTVVEPYPSAIDENEATVSVHTHHSHIGVQVRLFNPPTPEDYIIFVSRRVIGMLKKGVREHDANIVSTRRHVYEMTDMGTKNGIVSRLLMESNKNAEDVWNKASEMMKKLCCKKEDSILIVDDNGRFVLQENLDIFSRKDAHDRYLNFLEKKTGIRCMYEEHRDYTNRCLA